MCQGEEGLRLRTVWMNGSGWRRNLMREEQMRRQKDNI